MLTRGACGVALALRDWRRAQCRASAAVTGSGRVVQRRQPRGAAARRHGGGGAAGVGARGTMAPPRGAVCHRVRPSVGHVGRGRWVRRGIGAHQHLVRGLRHPRGPGGRRRPRPPPPPHASAPSRRQPRSPPSTRSRRSSADASVSGSGAITAAASPGDGAARYVRRACARGGRAGGELPAHIPAPPFPPPPSRQLPSSPHERDILHTIRDASNLHMSPPSTKPVVLCSAESDLGTGHGS